MIVPPGPRAAEVFVSEAGRLVARDMGIYGLPDTMYEALLRYLVDGSMHDFRLTELRELSGEPEFWNGKRRLLDLGCGPGTFVLKASQMGHDAVGIDVSEDKIALGHLWVDALEFPGQWKDRLRVADAAAMPFADEHFDAVSSYHVLEHVADLRSVLYEAVRVTKRGGWVHLCAPDYRMSYDTHYCMPWPRFMPRAQAERWTAAMGRPSGGVQSFFYITAPEVTALLQALGCRLHALVMKTHYKGQIAQWDGNLSVDPIIFKSDADIEAYAHELQRMKTSGTLPAMYETCLEFTILAQRL